MIRPKLYKAQEIIPSQYLKYSSFREMPLEEVPSVYFLCRAQNVVFVGASKTVARSVRSHPRYRAGRDYDSVKWAQVPEIMLNKVVRYWIWKLHPKYNPPMSEEPRFALSRVRRTRRCAYCGKEFPKTNPKVRYCSPACMVEGLLQPDSPPYDPACV